MIKKISLCPESIYRPFGNYSHAIMDAKTGLLVTSGQLGINRNGFIPDSFVEQTEICFDNILSIIKDAELTLDHVVRVTAFVTDRKNFNDYMAVRDHYFKDVSVKPASTLLVVSGFTKPEFLVEIEILAQK